MSENQQPGNSISFDDAPGGDLPFDSLFPAEPTVAAQPQAAPQQPEAAAQPVQPAPQTPAPPADEAFITGQRTVYKTREAAVEGINQKDALIENLRQRYALTTGIDPITQQPVGAAPARPQQSNYVQDPERWVKDAASALQRGDVNAYRDAQAKFVYDLLEPVLPAIQGTLEERAVKELETEIKDIRAFVSGNEYQAAMNGNPELRDAIEFAKADIRYAPRLAGLYKLAYRTSQGMRLPELLEANRSQSSAQPQVRTSTPSSTPAPPSPAPTPSLNTKEGRRAIIEAFENSSAANAPF